MKKTISSLAALALLSGGMLNQVNAGDCNYSLGGDKAFCASSNDCGFSYDFVDVAYMYSDYASGADNLALTGAGVPNGSIVDQMKGVNVQFMKSIGCNFYGVGEFYNTDGFLASQVVNLNPLELSGDRAEFYYYRAGLGYHHAITDNLDFTIDAGGLYSNCEASAKTLDEWGWYVSPGLRLSLCGLGELYGNYMYENFESMENHRFDGGAVIPVVNCVSVKLGGRYETAFEKTSFLAGLRFNY